MVEGQEGSMQTPEDAKMSRHQICPALPVCRGHGVLFRLLAVTRLAYVSDIACCALRTTLVFGKP